MERPATLQHIVFLCLVLLSGKLAFADNTLLGYEAQYIVEKYDSEIARSNYTLEHDSHGYTFSNHTRLTGFASLFRDDTVTELSILTNDLGLRSYRYTQTGSNKNRDTILNINNQSQHASGTYAGKTFDIQLNHHLWDPLSIQLALMRDVNNTTEDYHYHVLHKGAVKHYAFKKLENDTVESGDNSYHTTVLTRRHGKRLTKFWLANDHQYVPVKIEQYRKGELQLRLLIDSLTFSETRQ